MGFKLKLPRALTNVATLGAAPMIRNYQRGGNAAAIGGLVGGPLGGYVGNKIDQRKFAREQDAARMQDPNAVVNKSIPGGLAHYYDDSWGILQNSLQNGQGIDQTLQNILGGFKGKPGDLEDFLSQARPFLGAAAGNQLRGTDAFKQLNDTSKWDLGATASYAPAAATMGKQAAVGLQQSQNNLAASGLGRSAARSALATQAQLGLGAQQGNLWSQTYQKAQQNRMASAQNALDAHRQVAQIAMGLAPTPREPMQGQGNWLQQLGQGASIFGQIGQGIGGLAAL